LTQIGGLDVLAVQTILSEIVTDMSKWTTTKQFTSWLGLSPQSAKTGGRIIRTKTKPTHNRVNLAFRQTATALILIIYSQSALGNFNRRPRIANAP
jgi:Transposase IS116/IS110/IS902 family